MTMIQAEGSPNRYDIVPPDAFNYVSTLPLHSQELQFL